MNDDSHFLMSLGVELKGLGRDYYAERCTEIAAAIEELRRERGLLIEAILDDSLSRGSAQAVARALRDGGLKPTPEIIEWAKQVVQRIGNQQSRSK